MNRLIALVAVTVLLAGGAWFYTSRGNVPEAGLGSVSAQAAAEIDTSGIPAMIIGNPDAPVTVVEYASFTCPHCRDWHESVFLKLKQNYIDTGKVKFEMREVYFDRFGLWAGMLARCGGDMRYFGIVDILFKTQKEWAAGDPAAIAANLRRIGRTVGLNDDMISACLNDGARAQAMVALYQQNATADKVEGTPTFIINGTKYSNMGYDAFAKILDAELAKK